MPSFALPLAVAAVFTLGGYLLLRCQDRDETVGDTLGAVFLLVSVAAMLTLFAGVADRRGVPLGAAQIATARAASLGVRHLGAWGD